MKLKKYLAYAMVLLGVLTSSCNQQDRPLDTEGDIADKGAIPEITATLTLGEFRALEFDLNKEDLTLTDHPDNFDTHAYFYNPDKRLLGYSHLVWQVESQGNGRYILRLANSGNLKIDIIEGGTGSWVVKPNEEWYITGLAGGGVLSNDKKSISFPDNINQPRGRVLAPLSFPWTRYNKQKLSVHFRPLGVIVRPVVMNDTKEILRATSYIESNGLSNKGTFDISASIAAEGVKRYSHLPWTFEWDKQGRSAPSLSRTPFSVDQGGNTTRTYLTWGMVYREPSQHYKIRVSESSDRFYLKKSTEKIFDETLNLNNGLHYVFDLLLKIKQPVTPPDVNINQSHNLVDCWMQGNLKATGVLGLYPGLIRPRLRAGVWMDEGNPRSVHHDDNTYFSWIGISTLLSRSTPYLEKFYGTYLPSAYEFAQLFPNPTTNTKCINFGRKYEDITVTERVALGDCYSGSYHEYSSTYRSTGGRVVYALRHLGHGNQYRSAFRYELQNDVTGAGFVVKVQVYHLGPQGEATIDQISNEAWWHRHKNARDIYFAAPGYADLAGSRFIQGSQEYADSNVYENEDGYDSGYRYPRRPVLRRRPMIGRRPYPRRPYPRRPIYREPTVHEYGRSAYYWSCTGGYGLRFTSHDSGYYGSDESVSIQVGRIDTSRPYHGYTVRLKRSCSF